MGIAISRHERVVSNPNVVPLIDVLLVLIIIFMVITPQVSTGLPTFVPQPSPAKSEPAQENSYLIVVQVTTDGKLLINQDPTDWDGLGKRLSIIFEQRAEKVAFVQGSKEVSFEEVARVIDVMRDAGVERVGLITAPLVSQD